MFWRGGALMGKMNIQIGDSRLSRARVPAYLQNPGELELVQAAYKSLPAGPDAPTQRRFDGLIIAREIRNYRFGRRANWRL